MNTNAIRLTCPKCATTLSLKEAPAGGRCKCPQCQTIISTATPTVVPEVKASAQKPAAPAIQKKAAPAVSKPSAPAIKKAPAAKAAALPRKKSPDADKVAKAAPGEVKKDKTSLYMMIGGGVIVVGFFGLALLGGVIGLVAWGMSSKKATADTQQTAQAKDDTTPKAPPPKAAPPQMEQPPAQRPVADPGDGSLPADVLKRTKSATVYIRVQSKEGTASGSGFFEQTSGLVITNAHVVGMLKSKEPPLKVEVVLNSGGQNEVTLLAKLLDVDRISDLALLEVPLTQQQASAQPRLTVLPAKDLLETQRVFVFGFPFGERVNKSVTVSPSAVTSLHHNDDGMMSKVQVNGGMQPGNSGGPVVDPRGNVIGVAVAGIEGTQINFAIPGEQVQALLNGRMTEYVVDTHAVPDNGKFRVHVAVHTLDPRKSINQVSIDYWTGPTAQEPFKPSDKQPNLGNVNSVRRTVNLVYDATKRDAQGDLQLDAVPDSATNSLWMQAVITTGGKSAWQKSVAFPLDPPVDPKPIAIKVQYRASNVSVPVHLTSTAKYKLEAGGENLTLLTNVDTRMNETTLAVPPQGGAQVRLGVQKFAIGLSLDDEKFETSPKFQQAIKDIGGMVLDHQLDAKGNLVAKKINYIKQVVKGSQDILNDFGKQMNGSFEVVSVPLTGELLQPGQTWQAKRELPVPLLLKIEPVMMDVTYTYRGVRQYNGQQVAVVDMVGEAGDAFQNGKARGTILIDPNTGMVVQAKAFVASSHTAVVVHQTGRRGTLSASSSKATGTLEVKLQRGPGAN